MRDTLTRSLCVHVYKHNMSPHLYLFAIDFRAETGEKVYPIKNGGYPWIFGYVDVFHEMMNQVCGFLKLFTDSIMLNPINCLQR